MANVISSPVRSMNPVGIRDIEALGRGADGKTGMQLVHSSAFETGTSRLRLQTIVRLRWIAVLGQTATVVGVYTISDFALPIGLCLLVIALSAWLNVFLRIRFPASQRLKSSYATAMLGYDVLQLAALLYLTGGLQNPFTVLLVVPVTVSASTQPLGSTLLLGGLAVLCASVLSVVHQPLPWYPGAGLELPRLYVFGLWAAVVSCLVFIALYARRIAKEARQMSDALAATELVLAREQQLSALDGLAAAAAHGLGTPLSTITVVAKELMRELPEDSPHWEDLTLLRSQAERCREILSTLTRRADEPDLVFSQMPLSHLLEEVVEPHRVLGIPIAVDTGPAADLAEDSAARAEPVSLRNPGVLYGLGNLIENAVDFAEAAVRVEARWDDDRVSVAFIDDGPGFVPTVLERLGEPYVTTRSVGAPDLPSDEDSVGLGLGFFIAKTLLERSGARLSLRNREAPERGALVEVVWPRDALDMRNAPSDR